MATITMDRIDVTRRRLTISFYAFVKHFWRLVDPFPLVDDWYVRVLCNHLEAVVYDRGEQHWATQGVNLLINIPPRTGKSKILAVLFNAWCWAVDPKLRLVVASYSKEFASRDAKATRTLMDTEEYRLMFPHSRLRRGQNETYRYYTTQGGYRVTMSVDSGTTGEGGDIQVFDDPHDVSDSVSKRTRDYAIYYYQKIFFNRTETPNRARRIVCGQRVHHADVSATCINSKDPVYVHLNLPEEFDPKTPCTTVYFADPRRKEGELLRPRRFSQEIVEQTRVTLGSKTYAAIHQQKPMDDEGAMFKRRWFDGHFLPAMPAEVLNWIRCVDSACTEESTENPDPDWTATTLGGSCKQYPFVLGDVRQKRAEMPEISRWLLTAAQWDLAKFGKKIPMYFEAVAGFKAVYQQLAHGILRGWPLFPHFIKKNENKAARAICLQACAEAKGVWLVEGAWNEPFLEQLCTFSVLDEKGNEYSEYATTHDDMVDAATQCYNRIYGGGVSALVQASPMGGGNGQATIQGIDRARMLGRMIHGRTR